jgi:hypothetical protein
METNKIMEFPIATSSIRTTIISKVELVDYAFTSLKTIHKTYDGNVIPLFLGVDPNGIMHFLDFSAWPTEAKLGIQKFCTQFVLDHLIHVCAFVDPSIVSAPKHISKEIMLKVAKGEVPIASVDGAKKIIAVFVQDMVGLDLHTLENKDGSLVNLDTLLNVHKKGKVFWDFYINRKQ